MRRTRVPHVLLLGGSAEAAALAPALAGRFRLTTALAGATRSPRTLPGSVLVGGFGGAARLRRWLETEMVDALVDATHPFAARMARNARRAALLAAVPRVKLWRPAWQAGRGDRWFEVADAGAAGALAARFARRPLITLGTRGLAGFDPSPFEAAFVRAIEPPSALPGNTRWLPARPPFAAADERAVFVEHRIDVLITKNSGGSSTRAKLDVARERGLPVVMLERPPPPPGPCVAHVADVLAWLDQLFASRQT